MTDILDHLQPDSPLYEATRDAAREEIIRLRSLNKELAEALEPLFVVVTPEHMSRAQAALTKYRGEE